MKIGGLLLCCAGMALLCAMDAVAKGLGALPEGARPTITDRDFTIATIAAPTVVAEEAEAAQAAAEEEKEKEAAEAETPAESSSP